MVLQSARRDVRTVYRRRQVLRLISLYVGMIAAFPLLASCAQSAAKPAPPPAGSSSVTPTALANTPTVLPLTNTPEATEVPPSPTTAPATATSFPSPTAAENTPTPQPTAVPTVESTKAPEKPVLADYAVYSNGKDLVIADLPPDPAKDPSGKHWLFIYEGVFTHGNASLNDPITTGDNSFKVLGFGVQIADAQRDDTKKEITGDWQMMGGTTLTPFKLNFTGTGLTVLLHECEAVKTIAQQLGSGHIPDATMESQINDEFRKGYKGSDREGVYLHP